MLYWNERKIKISFAKGYTIMRFPFDLTVFLRYWTDVATKNEILVQAKWQRLSACMPCSIGHTPPLLSLPTQSGRVPIGPHQSGALPSGAPHTHWIPHLTPKLLNSPNTINSNRSIQQTTNSATMVWVQTTLMVWSLA